MRRSARGSAASALRQLLARKLADLLHLHLLVRAFTVGALRQANAQRYPPPLRPPFASPLGPFSSRLAPCGGGGGLCVKVRGGALLAGEDFTPSSWQALPTSLVLSSSALRKGEGRPVQMGKGKRREGGGTLGLSPFGSTFFLATFSFILLWEKAGESGEWCTRSRFPSHRVLGRLELLA